MYAILSSEIILANPGMTRGSIPHCRISLVCLAAILKRLAQRWSIYVASNNGIPFTCTMKGHGRAMIGQ